MKEHDGMPTDNHRIYIQKSNQQIEDAAAIEAVPSVRIPSQGWRLVDVREIWRFRELHYILAWRDVKVRVGFVLLMPIRFATPMTEPSLSGRRLRRVGLFVARALRMCRHIFVADRFERSFQGLLTSSVVKGFPDETAEVGR
jgi:hypothetical protein